MSQVRILARALQRAFYNNPIRVSVDSIDVQGAFSDSHPSYVVERPTTCSVSVGRNIYGDGMSDLPVEVIRSKRRKRTIQASLDDGRIVVRVPHGLDPDAESRMVEQAIERIRRKVSSSEVDLMKRARSLASKYGLPTPASVEWSSRQMKRWGSCSPDDSRIRISNRLTDMPPWVLDSVLIHELAHLAVPDHGPQFEELVGRYELAERAKGYLIAKSEGREQGSGHLA